MRINKCKTKLCSNRPDFTSDWVEAEYCEYAEARCPTCHALYWAIKRKNKVTFKDRKDGVGFNDHRKQKR